MVLVKSLDLPNIKGDYRENFDLSKSSWFGCGGKCDVLFKPFDDEDLNRFLSLVDKSVPIYVLGAMSNTLVRDLGINGVVIKLGKNFTSIEESNNVISFGSSVLDVNAANFAFENSIKGFEFLIGVPGTIGGNIIMNAGCYGGEISDRFLSCTGFDLNTGSYRVLTKKDVNFKYRSSSIKDIVITRADFICERADKSEIESKMRDVNLKREQAQPLKQKTCGSTFKNPEVSTLNPSGKKAWQFVKDALNLIPQSETKIGGAFFSSKHYNFMINDGTAKASDIEILGEIVRSKVFETYGINLEWEIKIIGNK